MLPAESWTSCRSLLKKEVKTEVEGRRRPPSTRLSLSPWMRPKDRKRTEKGVAFDTTFVSLLRQWNYSVILSQRRHVSMLLCRPTGCTEPRCPLNSGLPLIKMYPQWPQDCKDRTTGIQIGVYNRRTRGESGVYCNSLYFILSCFCRPKTVYRN